MPQKTCEAANHQCPLNHQCELINQNRLKMPRLIDRIQNRYCTQKKYCQCARFCIHQTLGLDAVPELMLPGQSEWAHQIVEDADCDVPAGK